MKRICTKCGEEKDISEFSKKNVSKNGTQYYQSRCKDCCKKIDKEYRSDPVWNKKKNDKVKKCREKKHEQYLAKGREHYYKNQEKILEEKREYRKDPEHKKRANEYRKKYVEENRERYYSYRRKNPHIIAWRNILNRSLRYLGKEKENHTDEEIGYTALQLKNHLESLFKEGMTWDNLGEWQIDHIKPLTAFEKDALPSEVNALSNLQPLWKEENIAKYNHWDGDNINDELTDDEFDNLLDNMSDEELNDFDNELDNKNNINKN